MEKVIESDVVKADAVENKKESVVKNIKFKELNAMLTIAIKAVVLILLVSSFFVGKSFYSQYAHYGPSCSSEMKSFNYWINKKSKGEVVSIHKSRLQTESGTTQCYGTFKTEKGEYKDWVGSVTELDNNDIVGQAGLN